MYNVCPHVQNKLYANGYCVVCTVMSKSKLYTVLYSLMYAHMSKRIYIQMYNACRTSLCPKQIAYKSVMLAVFPYFKTYYIENI